MQNPWNNVPSIHVSPTLGQPFMLPLLCFYSLVEWKNNSQDASLLGREHQMKQTEGSFALLYAHTTWSLCYQHSHDLFTVHNATSIPSYYRGSKWKQVRIAVDIQWHCNHLITQASYIFFYCTFMSTRADVCCH